MKLKKLELTAVEFFERVINGEILYLDSNAEKFAKSKDYGFYSYSPCDHGKAIGTVSISKPRTVWIEQQWYEDIPAIGIFCKFEDHSTEELEYLEAINSDSFSKKSRTAIVHIISCGKTYAVDSMGDDYSLDYLTPLTPEEIKAFLPAEAVTKYDESNWAENEWVTFPVTCRVSNNDPSFNNAGDSIVRAILSYYKDNERQFVDNKGMYWKYAIPVDE